MEESQNEYPSREVLWSFVIVWIGIGGLLLPQIIQYALGFSLNDQIETKFGFYPLLVSFPSALATGKLIINARYQKATASVFKATIISACMGLLFSIMPFVFVNFIPFLQFIVIVVAFFGGVYGFVALSLLAFLISALSGFIAALIALPAKDY